MVNPEGRREWHGGWPAACAGSIGAAASQIHFASIGVFIKPMTESLGWSAATVTMGIFICAIVSVLGSPFAGWLSDQFGLHRVLLIGLPAFFLSYAALGPLAQDQAGWVAGWVLVAVVGILVKSNLWMYWIAQKFDASRGLAMALVMCGAGVLAIFVPILKQISIEAVGWRMTFPVLAGTMAAIAIPVSIWGARACPPAAARRRDVPAKDLSEHAGLSFSDAVRNRAFWQILLIAFLVGSTLMALQVHLVPMFQTHGMVSRTAALAAGMMGGAALAGRFIGGLLLDRYPAKVIGMISLLLPAAACLLFLFLPLTHLKAMVTAALFGFGVGVEGDVLGYISSRYFGVRSFGTIFGLVNGASALGAGVGPQTMSLLLDKFGGYNVVVQLLLGALVLCAVLFIALGRYPIFGDDPARP